MTKRVCEALDYMHINEHAFGGRFDLLGSSDRSIGTFGVLQLATVQVLQVREPHSTIFALFQRLGIVPRLGCINMALWKSFCFSPACVTEQ